MNRVRNDHIKLSISLLSSGRVDTIEKCLSSLMPLKDAVSTEIIVVDTDASQNGYVRSIVEKYADKIIPFTWCNDFAAARNAGVRECSGEWFLFIDDDEWLENAYPIIAFLDSDEAKSIQRVNVHQRNFLTPEKKEYIDAWATRISRITTDFRFEGRVHEYFYPSADEGTYIEAVFLHTGYAYADEKEKQAHLTRNITLLEQSIQEEPYNLRWQYQLLMEYDSKGDFDKQREICEYALNLLAHEEDSAVDNRFRGMFAAARIRIERRNKAWTEATRQYESLRKETRYSDVAKAYMELEGAQAYHHTGQAEKSRACAEAYLALERKLRFDQKQLNNDGFYFLSETFEPHIQDLAMAILVDYDLKREEWDTFVRYYDRIGDDEYVKMIRGSLQTGDAAERLKGFTDACLRFFREDLKDEAMEQVSSLLPDSCRLALRLARVFAEDSGDWRQVLSDLKGCIGIYPVLDDVVTAYSHQYAQKIKDEENQKKALSPTAEMRSIIESLQEKVERFLQAGMIDEAEMILQQIEQFLPVRNPEKIQVYFLPYKAAMWDSMESVWREVADDPECEAHVMPIPYFERQQDGSLGEYHYEGDLLPEEVLIEDYRKVPLAVVHPDVIYFHNPYDDANLVTMVHPDYFSSVLKNECEELVYIPYFISGYSETKKIIDSQNQPGSQNASIVVMQSEAWKRACRNHFQKLSKFFVAGSPKLDAVLWYAKKHSRKELCEMVGIAAEKILLLNTSISFYMRYDDWYGYARTVVNAVKQSGQFLIWRPHPLLESAVKAMRPHEITALRDFVEELERSEAVLIDRSSNPLMAITVADALISDYSSMIEQFYITGKPLYVTEGGRNIRHNSQTIMAFDYFDAYLEEDLSVTEFITMVSQGEDKRKPLREKMLATNPILADGKAGERIHSFVKAACKRKHTE